MRRRRPAARPFGAAIPAFVVVAAALSWGGSEAIAEPIGPGAASVGSPTAGALVGGVALRERAELRQLTNSEVGVQNIFVADSLKRRLLEYARRHCANLDVLYRAEAAMRQPTRGAPHDDHFHARIACPPASVRATLCLSEPEAAQRPLRDRTAALDPTER